MMHEVPQNFRGGVGRGGHRPEGHAADGVGV